MVQSLTQCISVALLLSEECLGNVGKKGRFWESFLYQFSLFLKTKFEARGWIISWVMITKLYSF